MIYKHKQAVSIEYAEVVSDETIFRSAIADMVAAIPIEELKKIFNLNKIDPNSKEAEDSLSNPFTLDDERELIKTMRECKSLGYYCEISSSFASNDKKLIHIIKSIGHVVICPEGIFYNLPQWFTKGDTFEMMEVEFNKLPKAVQEIHREHINK